MLSKNDKLYALETVNKLLRNINFLKKRKLPKLVINFIVVTTPAVPVSTLPAAVSSVPTIKYYHSTTILVLSVSGVY